MNPHNRLTFPLADFPVTGATASNSSKQTLHANSGKQKNPANKKTRHWPGFGVLVPGGTGQGEYVPGQVPD